jgi:hypothetical protein
MWKDEVQVVSMLLVLTTPSRELGYVCQSAILVIMVHWEVGDDLPSCTPLERLLLSLLHS